jgi:hypothetical protein
MVVIVCGVEEELEWGICEERGKGERDKGRIGAREQREQRERIVMV